MDLTKYTEKAVETIESAQNLAIKNGNPDISELHLHYSLIEDSKGLIQRVLKKCGYICEFIPCGCKEPVESSS